MVTAVSITLKVNTAVDSVVGCYRYLKRAQLLILRQPSHLSVGVITREHSASSLC